MSFIQDFKRFAFRGNIVDLAVGVIIGGAFGKIVSALVEDIFMPAIGLMIPGGAWREAAWVLRPAAGDSGAVLLRWGHFVGAVLDLTVVALALFLLVAKLLRGNTAAAPAKATTVACGRCLEQVPLAATRCRACTSDLPGSG